MVAFCPQNTYSFRNLQDMNPACSSIAGWRHRTVSHRQLQEHSHNQQPHLAQPSLGSSPQNYQVLDGQEAGCLGNTQPYTVAFRSVWLPTLGVI